VAGSSRQRVLQISRRTRLEEVSKDTQGTVGALDLLASSTVFEFLTGASAVDDPLVAEAGERASELGESLIAVSAAMMAVYV